MKLYLSADIEGTCGIAAWDETEKSKPEYAPFANQMSREVSAACEEPMLPEQNPFWYGMPMTPPETFCRGCFRKTPAFFGDGDANLMP